MFQTKHFFIYFVNLIVQNSGRSFLRISMKGWKHSEHVHVRVLRSQMRVKNLGVLRLRVSCSLKDSYSQRKVTQPAAFEITAAWCNNTLSFASIGCFTFKANACTPRGQTVRQFSSSCCKSNLSLSNPLFSNFPSVFRSFTSKFSFRTIFQGCYGKIIILNFKSIFN